MMALHKGPENKGASSCSPPPTGNVKSTSSSPSSLGGRKEIVISRGVDFLIFIPLNNTPQSTTDCGHQRVQDAGSLTVHKRPNSKMQNVITMRVKVLRKNNLL